MKQNVEVVCLGILVADLFPSPIPRLPEPGNLMVVDSIFLLSGGCAAGLFSKKELKTFMRCNKLKIETLQD